MPSAILHVLGTAEPEGTATARIVAALAAGLDPSAYEVHAWFLGPPGPLIEDLRAAGARVRSINWQRGARNPVGGFRFWRRLKQCDFEVVHQHFGARSVRYVIKHSSRARLVVHLHECLKETRDRHSIPVEIQGAEVIIVASRAIATQVPDLPAVVVHAGTKVLNEVPSNEKAARATVVIGAACRLVPLKGLVYLIQAVGQLTAAFPHLRLEIAGSGPQRTELEALANRLGLVAEVRFLGWQRDLRQAFQSWDVFAMPTLDEGFGMAALEAMAAGLPVVATTVGGLPEIIDDGRTGYLVPPSDVAALSERLRLLILEPERRRAMGEAGRARVSEHFSVDRMVAEIAAIYGSLISAREQ
jgi:glycosyltransferase involved in cell wall biosynthesis